MDTIAPPQAIRGAKPAPADAGGATIAEDRLEGAKAIARFIDPNMTEREMHLRLERGDYPHWREGRTYVASKMALLAHWRAKTAQLPGQPQPATRQPQHKSTRRGYLGSPTQNG